MQTEMQMLVVFAVFTAIMCAAGLYVHAHREEDGPALAEHSPVRLKKPLSKLGLRPGDVGVVVHVYGQGSAYEVEFTRPNGTTIGVATVKRSNLRQA